MDIVCNFRKCRKPLSNQAWVTTCSHAFCVEHGKNEFKRNAENALTCPACGTELRDKFDVIQADLKPGETFRSIVLAGMRPDTIMDIAMRAMSFWSYQVEQETLYQENIAKHTREKLQSMEEINALNIQKLKAELETCKRKVTCLQTEFNKKRKQAEELTATVEEKTRKIQKLNYQLESYKRKNIGVTNFETTCGERNQEKCMDISELVGKKAVSEAFVFRPMKGTDDSHPMCSPKTPIFDFRNQNHKPKQQPQPYFQFRPIT